MRPITPFTLTALLVATFLTPVAALAASVTIIHGIDGRDLGAARALPVDIAVNGSCSLRGVTFTQSAAVELDPNDYTITVHPADGACGQSPVITESVTIPDDGSRRFSAVASLSRDGTPQLAVFNNSRELTFPPAISVRHLAKAGPVFVTFRSREIGRPQTSRIRNGKSATLAVLGDRFTYTATISSGNSPRPLARLSGTARRRITIFNVVGSRKNGFTVISETITP